MAPISRRVQKCLNPQEEMWALRKSGSLCPRGQLPQEEAICFPVSTNPTFAEIDIIAIAPEPCC